MDDTPDTPLPFGADPASGLDAAPASMEEPAITRAAKLCLSVPTGSAWAEVAVKHLHDTMLDHAWCEKKAAATAMAFVSRYPEDAELVRDMIALAYEEWSHFERVYRILTERGVRFEREHRDPYVNELNAITFAEEPKRFLDRLLVAALIEARSCERFALLAEALPPEEHELSRFYRELFTSEARHYTMFVRLALRQFDRDAVRRRLSELSRHEATVIGTGPPAPRMHG